MPGWSVIVAYTNQDVRRHQRCNHCCRTTAASVLQAFHEMWRNFWTTYEFQDETFRGVKIGGGVTLYWLAAGC